MSEQPGRPLTAVGITAAAHKRQALEFASDLAVALTARGVTVLVDEDLSSRASPEGAQRAPLAQCAATDMVMVLGGDGTLLRAARVAAPLGTPLLGVDFGSFGFLAAEDPDYVLAHVPDLLAGHYQTEPRMLLATRVAGAEGPGEGWLLACNDVIVTRGPRARLVRLRTTLDGVHMATFPADGLIVATATGSTAYNLSAGGPILDSRMEAMVVTAICPHTLYSRPLVLPATVEIGLTLEARGMGAEEAEVTVDGQDVFSLSNGQELLTRRAPWDAQLVRLRPLRFYERLREKLRWGTER